MRSPSSPKTCAPRLAGERAHPPDALTAKQSDFSLSLSAPRGGSETLAVHAPKSGRNGHQVRLYKATELWDSLRYAGISWEIIDGSGAWITPEAEERAPAAPGHLPGRRRGTRARPVVRPATWRVSAIAPTYPAQPSVSATAGIALTAAVVGKEPIFRRPGPASIPQMAPPSVANWMTPQASVPACAPVRRWGDRSWYGREGWPRRFRPSPTTGRSGLTIAVAACGRAARHFGPDA